eukprot:TRINITY_DN1657_c0_g1_i9.p1 TRINITY_DN1657_c0_g1~~TRINITY_DN1657_c0_g1_i9.p1  ORF type:complete len:400 (-),score=109.46 TRINITY_DN1657_c0_g1_i9:718-1917(-)
MTSLTIVPEQPKDEASVSYLDSIEMADPVQYSDEEGEKNRLRRKWNLLENFNAEAGENEAGIGEEDSELSQKFDELHIIETVPESNLEIHENKLTQESNQIASSEELSNPTYRSAASDFESKKESKGIPAEISPIRKPGESLVSPRLIKPNPDVKVHRTLAYISPKAEAKIIKASLPNPPKIPEENKQMVVEEMYESMRPSLTMSTLQTISCISSHPSLRQSQPPDVQKAPGNLRERKPKDSSASSYLSPDSLQLKDSESKTRKDDPLGVSESKSPSTMLKVQQLANSNKAVTLGAEDIGKYQGEGYRERMKHFLRQYIDNRLPEHLKSYKSSSQIFKMRLYQRFYDHKVNDENAQTINYPNDVEQRRTYTSEERVLFYHSQMEDVLKKSEQQINSFKI